MFNGSDFPKSLDEQVFNAWLENGRLSKIRYNYMLVIWDQYDLEYRAVYAESRDEMATYEAYETSTARESLIAAYDLYSETRIL
jgi:hypothetical protein